MQRVLNRSVANSRKNNMWQVSAAVEILLLRGKLICGLNAISRPKHSAQNIRIKVGELGG